MWTSEDLKAIVIGMNDEITYENKKSSKSKPHKNDSTTKLTEVIRLHNETLKYICSAF